MHNYGKKKKTQYNVTTSRQNCNPNFFIKKSVGEFYCITVKEKNSFIMHFVSIFCTFPFDFSGSSIAVIVFH